MSQSRAHTTTEEPRRTRDRQSTVSAPARAPSHRLHRPHDGTLIRCACGEDDAPLGPEGLALLTRQMREALRRRDYPCVAAQQSFFREDYSVGIYDGFGQGACWRELRADLLSFLDDQRRTGSTLSTMWAVFPDAAERSEDRFEDDLWRELSFLSSVETRAEDWGDDERSDPTRQDFALRLGGHSLFVVGLHPQSSRKARRFPFTALVVNSFDQFAKLAAEGRYVPMVETNRARDRAFQGDVNPMALEHGEKWESIQFSGKSNRADWKCPFRFMTDAEKASR